MKSEKQNNKMRIIAIDKVTLNIGAGVETGNVDKAISLLEKVSGGKVVKTKAKKRIAAWKLRPGLPIGAKITLRKAKALEVLKNLLQAVNNEIPEDNFIENGFSFGVKEYIDIPGVKYDPKIGIIGLQVTVTLKRPGYRVKKRKLRKGRIAPNHVITPEDAIAFAQEKLGVKIKEEETEGFTY